MSNGTEPTTIQQWIMEQSQAIQEELHDLLPEAGPQDFELQITAALALLRLDARKHCLQQSDLLRLLFLWGMTYGVKTGTELAADQLRKIHK